MGREKIAKIVGWGEIPQPSQKILDRPWRTCNTNNLLHSLLLSPPFEPTMPPAKSATGRKKSPAAAVKPQAAKTRVKIIAVPTNAFKPQPGAQGGAASTKVGWQWAAWGLAGGGQVRSGLAGRGLPTGYRPRVPQM